MKTIRRESRNVNLNRARLDKGQRCDEKNGSCCQDGKEQSRYLE